MGGAEGEEVAQLKEELGRVMRERDANAKERDALLLKLVALQVVSRVCGCGAWCLGVCV